MTPGKTTYYLQGCLNRLRAGDLAARNDLVRYSQERLRKMTKRALARYPGVRRFEETDDVLQNVLLRMNNMLDHVEVIDVLHFLRLASNHIRFELLDLLDKYFKQHGPGTNQVTRATGENGNSEAGAAYDAAAGSSGGKLSLADWTAFHEGVAKLPEDEREVFDLLWYQELPQPEAAEVLGVSLPTVKRRWQAARMKLMEWLGGDSAN
jgi:RNA polymerase sigma factor (sigma-70 family)